MIRLRLFHPGRIIWTRNVEYRLGTRAETWVVWRRKPADWMQIFSQSLQLMWIGVEPRDTSLRLANDAGRIKWHDSAIYTTIRIELKGFTPGKQELVSAALRKAVRFS